MNQQSGDFKDRWLIKAELVGIRGFRGIEPEWLEILR